MAVTIHTKKGPNHTYVNVYNSPDCHVNLTDLIGTNSHDYVIIGDFNAHHSMWGNKTTPLGRHLVKHLDKAGAVVLNDGSPTTAYGTAIDLTITTPSLARHITWHQALSLAGIHIAQLLIHSSQDYSAPIKSEVKWRPEKGDWQLYRSLMEEEARDLYDGTTEQSDLLETFMSAVHRAATEAIPKTRTKPGRRRQFPLSPEATFWQKEVAKAVRNFKKHRTPEATQELRDVQKQAKQVILASRLSAMEDWAKDLGTKNGKELWQEVNKLRGRKPAIPTVEPDNKAEAYIQDFTTRGQHASLPKHIQERLEDLQDIRTARLREAMDWPSPSDVELTFEELSEALTTKVSTAPGDDGLVYRFFWELGDHARYRLLQALNQLWNSGIWPESWKTATMVPIPKPSGNGVRPISLLRCISKITERILLRRLQHVLPTLPEAYGYVAGRGTIDAIAQIVATITRSRSESTNHKALVLFLDLDKAFERVNRHAAMDSLIDHNVKGKLLTLINSWMSNRHAKVKLQGVMSNTLPMANGVPQGSLLSPTIFNVIISSITNAVRDLPGVTITSYADDIAIVIRGRRLLQTAQKAVDLLSHKAADYGLLFSPQKTRAMYIHSTAPLTNIQLEQQDIEYVSQHRYLGVLLDRRLTFKQHVNYLADKLEQRINILRILGAVVRAPVRITKLLYTAIVQSVLEYGAPVLVHATQSTLSKLEVLQRKALRVALNLPRWTRRDIIHAESGIPRFSEKLPFLTAKYIATARVKGTPSSAVLATDIGRHKDIRVFQADRWEYTAGRCLNLFQLPTLTEAPILQRAPWHPIPILSITPKGTKKEYAQALIQDAENHLAALQGDGRKIYYTDASKDSSSRVGWGVYTHDQRSLHGRLPDYTDITTAEIYAICEALLDAVHNKLNKVVIVTDSQSAIATLSKPRHPLLLELVYAVWRSADILSTDQSKVTFLWVPSHTGIRGNEHVDKIAKAATLDVNISTIQPTPGMIKHLLKKQFQEQLHANLQACSKQNKKLKWFLQTTNNKQPHAAPGFLDRQLRLLRCGIYPLWRIKRHCWTCLECGGPFNIVHFLVCCPAHPALRHVIMQTLTQEEHNATDYAKAVAILRKANSGFYQPLQQLLSITPYTLDTPEQPA